MTKQHFGMKDKKNIINILAISVCVILFSIIPLKILFPVDFHSVDGYHEDLTVFSQIVVNNWLADGLVHDKFMIYGDFESVEFENNHNRCTYLSYPPGSFVPLYWMARATGQNEISVAFVKAFIQSEYYLSILLLSFLFYLYLKYLGVKSRFLVIFLPVLFSSLWAFLPYNVYYMHNVYFTDQAVILLSIAFFLIEIALYTRRLQRGEFFLQILSCVILFAGILTDYYFYCIALVAVCFRIIRNFQKHPARSFTFKLLSHTWPLMVSASIASALFFIQLLHASDGIKLLMVTFFIRAGSGTEWGGIRELAHHFGNGFTVFFIPVLIFVTVFCLVFPFIGRRFGEQKRTILNGLSLAVLSSVLHTVVLREHSIIHPFSMLKYNLVFVFIIFAFFCWLYLDYRDAVFDRSRKCFKASSALTICAVIVFIFGVQGYNQNFYRGRMSRADDRSIARFIRAYTNYDDVVYSPDYEIPWNPPQDLAISRKRVYQVTSPQDIPIDLLPAKAIINVLISSETLTDPVWNKLGTGRSFSGTSRNLYLFKFRKTDFRSAMD
jgi:hypothetical protein